MTTALATRPTDRPLIDRAPAGPDGAALLERARGLAAAPTARSTCHYWVDNLTDLQQLEVVAYDPTGRWHHRPALGAVLPYGHGWDVDLDQDGTEETTTAMWLRLLDRRGGPLPTTRWVHLRFDVDPAGRARVVPTTSPGVTVVVTGTLIQVMTDSGSSR